MRVGWRVLVMVVILLASGRGETVEAQEAPDTLPAGVGYAHPRSDATAWVHVIEYSDFGCTYCAEFARETFPVLAREFVATGRVRWTFVPFRLVGFRHADEAAEAAECAGEQEAFWSLHDRLFAEQERWSRAAEPADLFLEYARASGLDTTRFARCTQSRRMRGRILDQTSLARQMGARSTPTFFVNGRRIEGALPAAPFRALLLRELAAREEAAAPKQPS